MHAPQQIRVGRGNHNALSHQPLGLLQGLGGLHGGGDRRHFAGEQDKGLAPQPPAQPDLQQPDVRRLGGGVGGGPRGGSFGGGGRGGGFGGRR